MVLPGLGSSTAVSISSDSSSTPEMSDLATRKVKSSLRKRMAFSLFRNEKDAAMNGRIEAESREHSSSSTNSDEALISSLKQTTIIATMEVTAKNNIADSGNVEDATFSTEPYGPFCASAYLERMCGVDTRLIREEDHVKRLNKLPDDPSVQESIECVFAAQKDLLLQAEEEEDTTFANLQTPSSLQQCLLKNRSIFHLSPKFQRETRVRSPRKALEAQQIAPPTSSPIAEVEPNARAISAQSDARVCACRSQKRPILEPDKWPQRPLLLRPTPHGGTVVTGIRFAGSKEYLWKAQQSSLTWPEALHHHWKKVSFAPSSTHEHDMMCPHCMILPINNGKELLGESLLSDFESDSFSGSILVRLKDCTGTTCVPGHELTKGYFDGVHRRYQVVVRGQFKQSIPWIECFAGFQLERPAGKLPPKWIVNGALNVVRFFAPQLQTRIHGPRPYSLTPLGSTPQSLTVKDDSKLDSSMEVCQEEPREGKFTLIGHASTASSSMQRARYRKKHFDKQYAENSHSLMTDPNKVYTFEFLQHLLSFDDFSIELGSFIGAVPLQNILNGQPLQIMASHKHPVPIEPNAGQNNRLWCFDIWHEMLIPDAKTFESSIDGPQHGFSKMVEDAATSGAP